MTTKEMTQEEREAARAAFEQVKQDRRLGAAGVRFIETYVPPVVVPDGARVVGINDLRDEHLEEYTKWEDGYLNRTPKIARDRSEMTKVVERYYAIQKSKAPLINLAALEIVTFFLGRAPVWVRVSELTWKTRTLSGPLPVRAWDDDRYTLSMTPAGFGEPSDDPELPYHRTMVVAYLKAHDLLSHADRTNRPASTIAWAPTPDAIYLTGIPTLPLRAAVKRMMGVYVMGGRVHTVPWNPKEEAMA